MKKMTKFIITTAWIILSRAYDAFATYQYTPDLQQEANPLVSVFGLGWTPLLLIVGGLTGAIIYTYYVATFKPYNMLPDKKGMTFLDVSAYVYRGKDAHWTSIFYTLPKNRKHFIQYIGHIMPASLAYVGVLSTLMWLGINYTVFYKHIHSPALIISIMAAGIMVITIYWHWQMYRKYLLRTSSS